MATFEAWQAGQVKANPARFSAIGRYNVDLLFRQTARPKTTQIAACDYVPRLRHSAAGRIDADIRTRVDWSGSACKLMQHRRGFDPDSESRDCRPSEQMARRKSRCRKVCPLIQRSEVGYRRA